MSKCCMPAVHCPGYSSPIKLDMEGTAAVPGRGRSPKACPRVPAMPSELPAAMLKELPPVMPRGLTAVMGLSRLGNMTALLPAVVPELARSAMLPPLDRLVLAGMAELPPAPAMPMKEGKTALLPSLPGAMLGPLLDPPDSVSLQTHAFVPQQCYEIVKINGIIELCSIHTK